MTTLSVILVLLLTAFVIVVFLTAVEIKWHSSTARTWSWLVAVLLFILIGVLCD